MRYKAAIIGCGKIGSEYANDPKIKDIYTHAGAYTSCANTELVAICDANAEKAKQCKDRWSVPEAYTDYDVMLREMDLDIVSVCTPDHTHFEIIRTILESSRVKAVLAEKPLALHILDAQELVDLANEKGITLAVNYSRRYAEQMNVLKKEIQSETYGDIQVINGYYTKGIFHSGTHWLDLSRFLLGEYLMVKGFDNLKECNDDPSYDMYAKFECGASAFLHACDANKFSIFEMDIIGSTGRIYIKDSGHVVEIYKQGESPYYSDYYTLNPADILTGVMKDTLLHAVEDLVLCLNTDKKPRCSGADGVAAIRIANAVRQSVESGESVVL